MKKSPLEKYQRRNKCQAIVGTMTEESALRKNSYLKLGCNAFEKGKSQPISFWTEQDILYYLKTWEIPYCSLYGDIIVGKNGKLQTTGVKRTGCMFCMFEVHREKEPNRYQLMKITHPKQYQYCMEQLKMNHVLDYIGVPY